MKSLGPLPKDADREQVLVTLLEQPTRPGTPSRPRFDGYYNRIGGGTHKADFAG